ncbi:MAG TPA: molybdenum cofactor guanylyltransferase [Thermoanaerobaculia bacterium]
MKAYILVGGRSSRMGMSKTELFLDRIVCAARPLFEDVVAVGRSGGDALSITTIHEDLHDEEGPIFGLERALRDATAPCVVIAVDYPLVTAPLLSYLATRTEATSADVVVPFWHGRPQPLCAGYRPGVLSLIQTRIREGRYSLKGLLAATTPEMITETELRGRFPGEPLMNVNTPEEWQKAKELYG